MTTAAPGWSEQDLGAVRGLKALGRSVAQHFVGRRDTLDLLEVAVIAQEHLLLLGPPGTGKTDLVSRFASGLGGAPFVRLLTRFTEPAELFGPLDVPAFQDGRYTVRTDGMLPTARIAFLDEIFQSGSPILNTLLTVMNERVFHNGQGAERVPLICLIGAANDLPRDPSLLAFADRFLLRARIEPVAAHHLDELLEKGLALSRAETPGDGHEWVAPQALERLNRQLARVDLADALPHYTELVSELLVQGVVLSDRRITRGLRLVAAAALRAERVRADAADLWPLRNFWADPAQAPLVEEAVRRHAGRDTATPGEQERTVRRMLSDARVLGRQVEAGSSPAAVERVLRQLNAIRMELRRTDPGNGEAGKELAGIIDSTLALLDRE